jgi:uncharacterized protein (TIGR01777 family)
MKVLIAGGSGLVGTALTISLRRDGHPVSRMVRPGSQTAPGDVPWNPLSASVDVPAMEGFDAVVHLSGASIGGGRWTARRKQVLRSSRVDSTRVLVDALTHLKQPPRVFVCASATGFYGDRGDEVLTESSGNGNDFLSILCRAWEGEAARAAASGIRTVIMRFGIVLSVDGGALPRMLTPFRFGAGGRLGSGKQWMSWIALDDVVRVLRAAIDDANWNGPVNLVAPEPVRNAEFTRVLASGNFSRAGAGVTSGAGRNGGCVAALEPARAAGTFAAGRLYIPLRKFRGGAARDCGDGVVPLICRVSSWTLRMQWNLTRQGSTFAVLERLNF